MPLSQQAQAVVTAFGQQPGVTPDQVHNLQHTIDASPALTQEVNDAVAQGHLQRIVPLTNPHAGGEYNPTAHEMRLPLAMLTTPPHGGFRTGEPTFVLGHELQHGFNAPGMDQARVQFTHDLTTTAQSPLANHDYTRPLGDLIAASRRDEATAEISGWNAVVSAAHKDATDHGKAAPTLHDIYRINPGRMGDFIDVDRSHVPPTYAMKPNLTVNADLTMPSSAHNTEGMGQNFFDRPNTLGHNGNSTYANYYGAYAVGVASIYERHYNPVQTGQAGPHMSLDLNRLHLSPQIMAENGINLGGHLQRMPYQDTSTQPPTARHFDHTASSHTYTPIPLPGAAPSLDQASHPDHALYSQARDAVHRMDATQGRHPDQYSDNLAASLVVAARRDGMQAIHHTTLSDDASKVYAVQGELNSPLKRVTQVDTAQAVNTPIDQSSQAWNDVARSTPAQQGPSLQAIEQHQPAKHSQAPGGP